MHASGAVIDHEGRVLLVREATWYRDWDLPGGGVQDGEAPWEAVGRELREECGITVRPRAVVGLFFARDEPGAGLNLVWACDWIGGELRPQPGEIAEIGWFGEQELPEPMLPARRPAVLAALRGARGVFRALGAATDDRQDS